jgi:hypothetical protein
LCLLRVGVFPSDPVFFSNSSARELGLLVVRNMLSWYKGLRPELQAAVYGFTLLNEPGLGVVRGGAPPPRPGNTALPDNQLILRWLAQVRRPLRPFWRLC